MSALKIAAMLMGGSTLWSFRSAGAVATGINPTVAMPAGIQQNDLLIIAGVSGAGYTTPAGWTELVNQSSANPRLWMAYKIAGASESSVSVTNANNRTACAVIAYQNTAASSVLDVAGTLATSLTTTSLTTTLANDLVVSLYGDGISSATWGDPSGTTRRLAYAGDGTTTRAFLLVDELKAAAGATTQRTATISEASSNPVSFAASFKD